MRWDMRGVGAQNCDAAAAVLVVLTCGGWLEEGEPEEVEEDEDEEGGGRGVADCAKRGVGREVSAVELKGRADCCDRSSALGGAAGAGKSVVPAPTTAVVSEAAADA